MIRRPSHTDRRAAPGRLRPAEAIMLAALTAGLLLLAGCAQDGDAASPAERAASPAEDAITAPSAATEEAGEVVEMENCGMTVAYPAAPEQAVVAFPSVIETALALGVEDRITGFSFGGHGLQEDDIEPQYQAAFSSVDLLTGKDLSQEVLLGAEPDLVVGRPSTFDETKGLSREALARDGIPTFAFSSECLEGPPTWEEVEQQVMTLGAVFGVEERGRELAAEMQEEVDAVRDAVAETSERPRVFVYHQGETAPDTAGQGILDLMIQTAGGVNIFGDNPNYYATVTWEEVVARDPDVILLVDRAGGDGGSNEPTVAAKEEFLSSFPPLAEVTAITEDRMTSIPLSQVYMSSRNPEGAHDLAEFLHPDLDQ